MNYFTGFYKTRKNIICMTEDVKQEFEWWETFDGILEKLKELKEENEELKLKLKRKVKKSSHEQSN